MGLRYLSGWRSNLLQRASAITVTNENASFPKTALYDDTGAVFMGSAEASPFDVTVDLGLVPPNGDFESAFTGGLPTSAWAKTSGATLTRNTTDQRTGTGCLQATGTTANYGYYDLTVYPGQRLTIVVAGRSVSGTALAKVRVRNLFTGRLLDSNGAWQTDSSTVILSNDTTNYVVALVAFQVETAALPSTMTLRVEFVCGGVTDDALYDDAAIYYAVNCCSVHWSNLVGAGANGPTLRSSTDNFSGSDTQEAQFDVVRPAFYALLSSAVYRRYWRVRSGAVTALVNAGAAPYIGELVLGYAETAARAQDYGWTLGLAQQQIRTRALFGAEAVYQAGLFEQRRLGLNFRPGTAAEYLELRDRWYRMTRGGADSMVVIPYDAEDQVIHGRLGPELAVSRELITRWGFPLEVLETAPPMVVG
jgi:hypothetical protein